MGTTENWNLTPDQQADYDKRKVRQEQERLKIADTMTTPATKARKAAESAGKRSREIAGDIENATGDENEYDRLARMAETGIDKGEHDTGRAVAESWARRGLGGSGMARGEGMDILQQAAQQRASSLDQARAAAIASQRADLAQEQAGLIGAQTSDINAQRLAMEQQSKYEDALAAALEAFGQGVTTYGVNAYDKRAKAEANRGNATAAMGGGIGA